MNPRYQSGNHQEIAEQIVKVLADNSVTYEEAPRVLECVKIELNNLCRQQVIQVPNN